MNKSAISAALIKWATIKGMKPGAAIALPTSKGEPAMIRVSLLKQFNDDPLVPNVDYLVWKETHPGSVTGYRTELHGGKISPQVRGGWVDFICPKGV